MQAILLVDSESRRISTIEIAELKRFDIYIISDLKELLSIKYHEEPVIVLESFLKSEYGISEIILYKELIGLNYIFITNNDVLFKEISRYGKVFSFDISKINYSMIISAINDDNEAAIPFTVRPENKFVKIAKIVLENPGITDDTIKGMSEAILKISEYNEELYSRVNELENYIKVLESLNQNKASQLSYLSSLVDTMLQQTIKVNDALSQYSFLCQKEVYCKVAMDSFEHHPKIIYFKEYGDFLHLNTFIFTLAETLKRQYDFPVKVLWVMDKNNPLRQKYIPKYYTIFSDGIFQKTLVHISDYMCTTGGYAEILHSICENQSGVEYLIVLDTKLVDDTILRVIDVLRFDLCRNSSKIKEYGLLDSRTIVNNVQNRELSWNHYYEYASLNEKDRFLFLANRPVINRIIQLALSEFD